MTASKQVKMTLNSFRDTSSIIFFFGFAADFELWSQCQTMFKQSFSHQIVNIQNDIKERTVRHLFSETFINLSSD